jgi:DNA-binding PadR family transcriptional regulator
MLYKHLKKLARLGWITMSLQDQSPRPPRQVCHLTPAGEIELQRWLAEPVARTREIRLEFLVKLYFAWQLDLDLAHRLANEQREVMLRLADSISSQIEEYTSTLEKPDDEDFGKMVLQLRLEQTVSAVDWLERVAQAAGQIEPDR